MAETPAGIGPRFKGPVGLQLYSLRNEFATNVPTALQKVRSYGFKYVETAGNYNLKPAEFKKLLDEHGLKAISGHFPYERFRDDSEGLAREAKTHGLQFAGCPWIPHEKTFNEKECRDAIAVFNRAGEALAKRGLKFFYHCHGYEFQPHSGGTLLDLLIKETNPKVVRLEMDVFWVVHPGQDPVKWLEKYPNRWELMHLKDMKKGIKGDSTGDTEETNDVALGTGQMDWPAILKAARKAGVKWYFIEDESPTVTEQLRQSLRYLEQLKW